MSDDEGPSNRDAAREHVKAFLAKPEHKRPKGHPDDLATVDGDIEDPKKQEKDK